MQKSKMVGFCWTKTRYDVYANDMVTADKGVLIEMLLSSWKCRFVDVPLNTCCITLLTDCTK